MNPIEAVHPRPGARRRLLGVLIAVALLLAACGGGDKTETPTAAGGDDDAFPVVVTGGNGDVSLAERPTHIVSLSPTATEILFAIGAGDEVVAVDDQSNYPKSAPTTDLSGVEPNLEAIAGYEPDLLVASNDPKHLFKDLKSLKIPALLQPAATTIDDTYAQIEQLGIATGHQDEATQLVTDMKDDIATIVASVPEKAKSATYYHELDNTYFTVTSDTFIGQVYEMLGLRNIADAAPGSSSGYPQLSAEYIIDANPDLIFLADTVCCHQSEESVAKRPGWDQIAAVRNGGVVELNDDVASRWGPRIVDLLRIVARRLESVLG
ncbi:MAG TPA: ABC transporter substrate-binding protein [Actinomycetota bacterium]|nr:ABC transporter substrate-binding protein [Actinomycetota bacterium]